MSKREVSVTEAHDRITRLIRDAEAGARITITRQGRPVARLVPYGLAVDDLELFEELMDGLDQLSGQARDYVRRRHTTTTPQEDQ